MDVRSPAVAGQFYPGSERDCRSDLEACLAEAARARAAAPSGELGVAELFGGIVPHAGWMCSGAVAAEVFATLCREAAVDTVVVFGAAHRLGSYRPAVCARGLWRTPIGQIAIDEELAAGVLSAFEEADDDPEAHRLEHSIEVQVPFIQHLAPAAKLLPILVPHPSPAPALGPAVAEQARLLQRKVLFVGSSDLTHYGPRYGFTPHGVGPAGLAWAKNVNDRDMLNLMCRMEADRLVPEAKRHQNACGAAAAAATINACRRMGATRGILLRHVTSEEVLRDRYGEMTDAVGYGGIVFARPLADTHTG